MNPEQQIVNLWLNNQGFFTVNDINAGKRVIDIIAIRQEKEPKIQHVEVNCSVSGNIATKKDQEELLKRFNSKSVVRAVNKNIKELLGKSSDYEKVLVTTYSNVNIGGVTVLSFDKALADVVSSLDTQNYRNTVIRSMQLLKYLLLSNPESMSQLLGKTGKKKVVTQAGRERLATGLLTQETVKKAFKKKKNEKILMDLLVVSPLRNPERLSKALRENLTSRGYNKMLKIMLKDAGVKRVVVPKKQKLLGSFLNKP
jgi:hypothetical protein